MFRRTSALRERSTSRKFDPTHIGRESKVWLGVESSFYARPDRKKSSE